MEITSQEQNKVKRMKRTEDSQRPLGQYQMHQHSNYRGPRRRIEKERVWENFWSNYSWKFPQHGKINSQSSPRGAKSPIQDKHLGLSQGETRQDTCNQTNKD